MEFVNEPNVSTPIQGSSSVVKDLHAYKASTICTCYNGGGDGGGGKVNKGRGGKVNKGGGGKVEVITACRSFTTDEDPWIGVETFGSLTNSNCPNSSPASVVPEISPCRYLATQKSSESITLSK